MDGDSQSRHRRRHDLPHHPYLNEADQLADRVAVLDRGRIVAEGTLNELKRRIPGSHIRLQFTTLDALHAAERALTITVRDEHDLTLQVPSDGNVAALRRVLDPFE